MYVHVCTCTCKEVGRINMFAYRLTAVFVTSFDVHPGIVDTHSVIALIVPNVGPLHTYTWSCGGSNRGHLRCTRLYCRRCSARGDNCGCCYLLGCCSDFFSWDCNIQRIFCMHGCYYFIFYEWHITYVCLAHTQRRNSVTRTCT